MERIAPVICGMIAGFGVVLLLNGDGLDYFYAYFLCYIATKLSVKGA
jgi:hypothetical protein